MKVPFIFESFFICYSAATGADGALGTLSAAGAVSKIEVALGSALLYNNDSERLVMKNRVRK